MRSVHYRILRSHKDTPHDPSASYLILSLAGQTPILRAFSISGNEAVQEDLVIEEDTSWMK